MADIAKAYVQIIPKAEGIQGELTNILGGAGSSAGISAGGGIASGIKKAIVGAGIGVAVGKVVNDSMGEGSALQQSIGGIETLFGNQGKTIREYAEMQGKTLEEVTEEYQRNSIAEAKMMQYAKEAYASAGMSRNEYMQNATSFAATLLQGLEGDTVKAADFANMAMQDMSDNANKFGSDISSIQNAYQGFAKDNYTMLDNLKLGYGGTAGEMARLLNDAGLLEDGFEATAKNVKDIPFNTIIESINVIQSRLGVTGTTADEASKTFEGSMKAMQAAAKNLLAGIALGEDVTEPLYAMLETLVTFVENNMLPMIANILQALPEVLGRIIEQMAGDAEEFLPKLLDMITGVIGAIGENLPYIISGILEFLVTVADAILSYDWSGVMGEIFTKIQEAFSQNLEHILTLGLDLIMMIVQGIVDGLPLLIQQAPIIIENLLNTITAKLPEILTKGIEILRTLIDGLVNNADELIAAVIQIIKVIIETTIQNLPLIVSAGIEILLALISGIIQAIPELIAECFNLGYTISDTLMNIDWIGLGVQLIGGIAKGIFEGMYQLTEAVSAAANKALSTIKSKLGIASPSKVFRDDVGKMIDLGMAEGIESYTNPIKNAMNGLSDMTSNRFNAATQLQQGGSYQNAELAPVGYGDLTVPVYIGQQKFATAVVNANQINNYRNGGR